MSGPHGGTEQDTCTRELCQRCHRVSPIGFSARKDIWWKVAGRHWEHSILCIMCFAQLGDEKYIAWEEGIEFHPVSFVTNHEANQRPALAELEEEKV